MANSFLSSLKTVAFAGEPGAYADLACRAALPSSQTVPLPSFEDAFRAVENHQVDAAMIPIDNTLAGRVADVHSLIARSSLSIVGEHFEPIRHMLLGLPGTSLATIRHVYSHIHALPQCRLLLSALGAEPHVFADTAGAAAFVAASGDPARAAIASALAGELYGLEVLKADVQDAEHNTTRFVIFAREATVPPVGDGLALTALMFEMRHIPASLYKALGGFATNGLQLAKIESYVDASFGHARFYLEVEGHRDTAAMRLALEELGFYARTARIIGCFAAHAFRQRHR